MGDIGDLLAQGALPRLVSGPVRLAQLQQAVHLVQQLLRRAVGYGQPYAGGTPRILQRPEPVRGLPQGAPLGPHPKSQPRTEQGQQYTHDQHAETSSLANVSPAKQKQPQPRAGRHPSQADGPAPELVLGGEPSSSAGISSE